MKKVLLLSVCLLCSSVAFSQEVSDRMTMKQALGEKSFDDFFPVGDMKLFNDRIIMLSVAQMLYNQQNNPSFFAEGKTNTTQGIFSQKDSEILEKTISNKSQLEYGLTDKSWDEYLKTANGNPKEFFKQIILNSSIKKISNDDIKNINQVDKKAVSKMLQMVTESGPELGSNSATFIYNNETQE